MRANARIFLCERYRMVALNDRSAPTVLSQLRRHWQCDAVDDGVPAGAGGVQLQQECGLARDSLGPTEFESQSDDRPPWSDGGV